MKTGKALIYGVTGYTGALISREAQARGVAPVVAGRREGAVRAHAEKVGMEARAFSLDDGARLAEALRDVSVVLNAAGPFKKTAEVLSAACVEAGAHYLDISGEVNEFDVAHRRGAEAAAKDVMLMPGVGFGVVPTDVVARGLAERLPGARSLALAFETVGGVSRGTLSTLFADIHRAGVRRVNGEFTPARPASEEKEIDLGAGPRTAVLNPWRADLLSAGISTGIADITTYTVFPAPVRFLMRSGGAMSWILERGGTQRAMERLFARLPEGPTEKQLAEGRSYVWGEATDAAGRRVKGRLEGPEAYRFTAMTAAAILGEVHEGRAEPGFKTPAQVFGSRFLDGFEGVTIRWEA